MISVSLYINPVCRACAVRVCVTIILVTADWLTLMEIYAIGVVRENLEFRSTISSQGYFAEWHQVWAQALDDQRPPRTDETSP